MRPDKRLAKFGRDYYRGRPGVDNRMAEMRFVIRRFTDAVIRAARAFERLSPELQQAAIDAKRKDES